MIFYIHHYSYIDLFSLNILVKGQKVRIKEQFNLEGSKAGIMDIHTGGKSGIILNMLTTLTSATTANCCRSDPVTRRGALPVPGVSARLLIVLQNLWVSHARKWQGTGSGDLPEPEKQKPR